jgi:hypothetical protein
MKHGTQQRGLQTFTSTDTLPHGEGEKKEHTSPPHQSIKSQQMMRRRRRAWRERERERTREYKENFVLLYTRRIVRRIAFFMKVLPKINEGDNCQRCSTEDELELGKRDGWVHDAEKEDQARDNGIDSGNNLVELYNQSSREDMMC